MQNMKKTEQPANMKQIGKCPACGASDCGIMFQVEKFPAILFPVEHEKTQGMETRELSISECTSCRHMFIKNIDVDFNNRIYSHYYYLYPFSNLESMNDQYRIPFRAAFDFMTGKIGPGKKLLEIGCSDESQFSFFIEKGIACTGISPEAAPSDKVEMIDGFYEERDFKEKFDYVISRFNLEHIIDPEFYLSKIKREIKDGGLFFVQVPNVEYFLKSGLLNVFAHEHTQYFNPHSLETMLKRHGFEVVLMKGHQEPSLVFCARVPEAAVRPKTAFDGNQKRLSEIASIIDANKGKKIVVYGAGLSLTAMLYFSPVFKDRLKDMVLMDDNKLLWGKAMPLSESLIGPFNPDMIDQNTVVLLLLSQIYHHKVLPKLQETKAGAIYRLAEEGIVRA